MIQNLFNNINNFQDCRQNIGFSLQNNNTQTDFQQLYNKQNNLEEANSSSNVLDNDKEISENKKSNEKRTVEQDETFAGSVISDIKELISFLMSASQNSENSSDIEGKSSDDSDDTSIISATQTETESTDTVGEELDAEKIAKKILHLEEDDEDEKDDKKEVNTSSENTENIENAEDTEEITEQSDNIESVRDVLNFDKISNMLESSEVSSDEVQTVSELQTAPKETEENIDTKIEDIIDDEQLKELNIESLEAESSETGDNSSDLMNQQSPEEQGVKAMLQTDADFSLEVKTEIKPTANVQNTAKTLSEANSGRIIEQISRQLENMTGGSKVNIVLNPESLGKVSLQLINTKEGLSAQFTVATQDAKNLLMKGLDGLKDTLIAHGVSVDNVSVKMNDTQDTSYNADWTEQEGSRGGNKEQGARKGQQERESFEQMMSFVQDEEK